MGGRGRAKAAEGGRGGYRLGLASAWIVGGLMGVLLYRPRPSSAILARPDIHSEYVKFLSGRDTITAYLAYPERKDPAPAVVVIHEIFGMSDFIRQTAEQLAKDGFVAIAPDLLSRRGGTPASGDSARKLIAQLDTDTLTKDVDAMVAYVKRLKAVRPDRVGVIGVCWGGGQSLDRESGGWGKRGEFGGGRFIKKKKKRGWVYRWLCKYRSSRASSFRGCGSRGEYVCVDDVVCMRLSCVATRSVVSVQRIAYVVD